MLVALALATALAVATLCGCATKETYMWLLRSDAAGNRQYADRPAMHFHSVTEKTQPLWQEAFRLEIREGREPKVSIRFWCVTVS